MKEPTTHYAKLTAQAQYSLIREAHRNMGGKIIEIGINGYPMTANDCSYVHAQAATIMEACEATLKTEGFLLGKRRRVKP
jgi:hypothetical protein